jgi:hypothetical protein
MAGVLESFIPDVPEVTGTSINFEIDKYFVCPPLSLLMVGICLLNYFAVLMPLEILQLLFEIDIITPC